MILILLIMKYFYFSTSLVNIRKLMNFLDQQQLANLCRVLSFSLTDLESVEERSTCKCSTQNIAAILLLDTMCSMAC